MLNKLYCGQCGAENATANKFCGQCGSILEFNAEAPVDYEYQEYEWRVFSENDPDCVYAREGLLISDTGRALQQMTEHGARTHFWQKYQKDILIDFQKWQDDGWRPITEIGAACVELEKSSTRTTSGVASLLKAAFLEKWCLIGASIKVRRPKPRLILSDTPDILTVNHRRAFLGIAISPNGEQLVSGGETVFDGDIGLRYWNLDDLDTLENIALKGLGDIDKIRYLADGNRVAFTGTSQSNKVFVLDIATREIFPLEHNGHIRSMAFSPNGKLMAAGTSKNELYLWDIEERQAKVYQDGRASDQTFLGKGIFAVAFTSDGRYCASGAFYNTVRFRDVNSGQVAFEITLANWDATLAAYNIAFSSKANIMAIAKESSEIELWDWQERRMLRSIYSFNRDGVLVRLAFSPDGSLLVGGARGNLRLWRIRDLKYGNEGYSLPIPDNFVVRDVVFSPNGKLLASGHGIESRLWKVNPL